MYGSLKLLAGKGLKDALDVTRCPFSKELFRVSTSKQFFIEVTNCKQAF